MLEGSGMLEGASISWLLCARTAAVCTAYTDTVSSSMYTTSSTSLLLLHVGRILDSEVGALLVISLLSVSFRLGRLPSYGSTGMEESGIIR